MRMTRATLIVAILLGAAMVGLPALPGSDSELEAVGSAAAVDVDRLFTIGTIEIAVSTLNPFTYTMADEFMAIWPCMSTMLTYNESRGLIGDLAKRWSWSADGLTWTFNIVDNAYFVERTNPTSLARPLTVDDIIYTYGLVQNYSHNLHYYFPGKTDGSPPVIQGMSRLGPYTMSITLTKPYAPFVGALAGIPIVPKYYWEPLVNKAGTPQRVTGVLPIGTGPFYYDLPGLPTTGEIVLKRSPLWFQEANKGWQIHVDTWKLRQYGDSATIWLELKAGNVDVMMGVPPSTYVGDVPGTPYVTGYAQSTGFVYEYNLNQMSTTMRAQLVAAGWNNFRQGTNNQLLLDPVIKQAMAMAVNKPGWISDVLEGLGTVADSLIADVNPWYYHYGSSPGETPIPFNTAAARSLLWANGWKYNAAGTVVPETSTQCPLYGYVDGVLKPLSFRFYTLSADPEWAAGASLLKTWAAAAGVQLNLEIKSTNQMNSIWWNADYDAWLWDWMFTPLSDPSTDVLSVLTTMEIGSWSDVYYSNATFDDLYNRSVIAMDPTARREIVNEMQRMAYLDMSCQCIAYRKELYAVSTKRWVNYGDWNTSFMLMPDQGYPYLYMRISPNGAFEPMKNQAPLIQSLADKFEGYKNSAITFTGTAYDTSTLNYQWYWGDGTKSGWLTSPTTTHTYTSDGIYEVYFAAKETTAAPSGAEDYYITSKQTSARVIDPTNGAPTGLSIGYVPASPDTGDIITFTGSATDPDGDTLYYSWNFGDTYTGLGKVVTHQYITPGTYTVVMSVTDGRIGTEPRPVTTSRPVSVSENRPPTIDVPDFSGIWWKQDYTFTVTASDPDGDALRYTWFWGDGTKSVTTTNSAVHQYSTKGTKTLRVYADDLTGLKNHNVTDTGIVQVIGTNKDPTVSAWSVSKTNPYSGEKVTFTAAAKDQDRDYLILTLAFGDGTKAVRTGTPPGVNIAITFTVNKTYAAGGTYSAYLYVYDGVANISSSPIVMNVVQNDPPFLWTPLADTTAVINVAKAITIDPYDGDGDPMKFTWIWGDNTTTVTTSTSVSHTYTKAGEFVYRLWIDDAHGHNVTYAAIMRVQLSYAMNLVTGWNLVTVPMVGHSYKASTLGLQFGDVVVGWNPATKVYDRNYIVGISPAPLDFAINPSEGYWIYAGGARALTLYGDAATDPLFWDIVVPSGGGWAIIGIASLNSTLMASHIPDMYSGGAITVVATWNAVAKTWRVYYPGLPFTDYALSPGWAAFVYCTASGTLSYDVG